MQQTIGIAQEIRRKNISKRKPCAISRRGRESDESDESDEGEKVFKRSFLQKAQCRNDNNL